jgi:hypothetical protein
VQLVPHRQSQLVPMLGHLSLTALGQQLQVASPVAQPVPPTTLDKATNLPVMKGHWPTRTLPQAARNVGRTHSL